MREIHIYVDQPLTANSRFMLPPAAAHHVAKVLRLKPGQPLLLFNGEGGFYMATIDVIAGKQVQVQTEKQLQRQTESPLHITLVQAISRGKHMDYTLQKAVELGVQQIVPVISARSQVRLNEERVAAKLEHWRGVLIAACEQSGRDRLPRLLPPQLLHDWLQLPASGLRLLLDPLAERGLRALPAPASALILVSGPEGGFSADECHAAAAAGCTPVHLGPRILRTETAAPAAITACQALWGDLS
ncbi:MAG: 16S rRNA (uracil(1498)-N(3))-methyltransferase [Gammaproteobacteria bacterium]